MKFSFSLPVIILSAILLSFSGCHKDAEPKGAMGTLQMHLHNYIGTEEVDAYNVIYTLDGGRKISFSIAQFYLSNIQLEKADGSIYTVKDTIILKTQDQEAYVVAKVPVGDYKSVRFTVGLDSVTNLQWPTASGKLNHSEMWFDATAQPEGYIYLNVQGKIDTTADASGSEADMQPFSFRIGTNKHVMQVVMPQENFTVSPNMSQFVHIYADLLKLFDGLQLNDPAQLHINTTWDNNSLPAAGTVSANATHMFVYE